GDSFSLGDNKPSDKYTSGDQPKGEAKAETRRAGDQSGTKAQAPVSYAGGAFGGGAPPKAPPQLPQPSRNWRTDLNSAEDYRRFQPEIAKMSTSQLQAFKSHVREQMGRTSQSLDHLNADATPRYSEADE